MRVFLNQLLTGIFLLATVGLAGAATVPAPGHALYNVKVKSLVDLRFKNVVRQAYDLSCGAAALATLLTYFYAEDTDEQQIIEAMFELGDKEKIQKDGFSMLELKRYGEQQGYLSQGYRVKDAGSLNELKIPAITLINTRGYNHFVVIKGIQDGQVFIADPAFGNSSRPLDSFGKDWTNVILVLLSATNGGNNLFTLDPTLRGRRDEIIPLLDRGLFHIRPSPGEF
jgi:predicted double-glycine peptidase